MPAVITVEVHDELRALLPGFLANRTRDLQQLAQHLDRSDFAAIRNIAHNMKGVGSGYGFDVVTELGVRLEEAAGASDARAAAECLTRYRDFMANHQVVFI